MSLGGATFRQHLVEFIPGVGIKTDNIVDATSVNGPWTWIVPPGVTQITMDVLSGGQGGAGGGSTSIGGTISAGGGGGGSASRGALNYTGFVIVPGESLTVSVGSGGGGGSVGGNGGGGGHTTISKTGISSYDGTGYKFLRVWGAAAGGSGVVTSTRGLSSTSASAAGGTGGAGDGTNASGGTNGGNGAGGAFLFTIITNIGSWLFPSGMGGGAGNASGSVAGGSGGSYDNNFQRMWGGPASTPGTGNTTGTISRGGGGGGATTFFNQGIAPGGNGGSAGTNAPFAGGGGGGGGAGAAGGSGGPGYVRFIYWSAD